MSKYDVIALGELLIDFSNTGLSSSGNYLFEANPGGAPCNVLSMLNKLGKRTAFIGKVGNDFLGNFLAEVLVKQGINVENLSKDNSIPTTLAFVSKTKDGDRSFSFYRNPGADMMLRDEDIDTSMLDNAKIFHFGTLSMTDKQIENTTKNMVKLARKKGMLISFDPNLRPPLWDDLARAREMIEYGMHECDILKISDNEVEFVTGLPLFEGISALKEQYNPRLMCVTLGKDGSVALYKDMKVSEAGFIQEHTVDTTGAGDTFMGCIINSVLDTGIDSFDEQKLRKMLLFANAAASIITTRTGALTQMPEINEIKTLLAKREE